MGNRVAELITPGTYGETLGFAVYQSTSGAMFAPIFHLQLSAELFALALRDIYPLWDDANLQILAGDVRAVITEEFGDEPERHPLIEDALDPQNLEGLLSDLRGYRARKAARAAEKAVKP